MGDNKRVKKVITWFEAKIGLNWYFLPINWGQHTSIYFDNNNQSLVSFIMIKNNYAKNV